MFGCRYWRPWHWIGFNTKSAKALKWAQCQSDCLDVDKIEGWNSTQGLDFADKPVEWTVNSAEHVWMNLNKFDEI
jgi:hypothetical protein